MPRLRQPTRDGLTDAFCHATMAWRPEAPEASLKAYVERHGVPEYDFPELAAQGLRALVARGRYEARLARGQLRPPKPPKRTLERTHRW